MIEIYKNIHIKIKDEKFFISDHSWDDQFFIERQGGLIFLTINEIETGKIFLGAGMIKSQFEIDNYLPLYKEALKQIKKYMLLL